MSLREEDVSRIGEYVKPWLREVADELFERASPRTELATIGPQLLERIVRVEEELKNQRDLMDERFGFTKQRFEAVDKRFDELISNSDKRFEAADCRFQDLIGQMNRRFNALTWMISVGFVVITSLTTVFAVLA